MNQERMKILTMLEDGKITAEDAVRLLEFVNTPGAEDAADAKESEDKIDWQAKFGDFAQNVNGFAKDFGAKVESAYRDLEPKLKKVSYKVVEKTAIVIDDISKALNESLRSMDARNGEAKTDEACCKAEDECKCECEDDQPKEN